jgi:hypothetical protein
MAIHRLLVENGVIVVFPIYDHLFANEELDGVIYQEVSKQSHPSGGARSAEEYSYTGVILGSSGHGLSGSSQCRIRSLACSGGHQGSG